MITFKQYLKEQYKEPPMSLSKNNAGHNPSGPGWVSATKFLYLLKPLNLKKTKDYFNYGNEVMSEFKPGRMISVDDAKLIKDNLEEVAKALQFQRGTNADIPDGYSRSAQITWWKDFTMTKEYKGRKVHYPQYTKYQLDGYNLYSAHQVEISDDRITEGPIETFYATSTKRYWFAFSQSEPSKIEGVEGKVSVSLYTKFPVKADIASYLYHIEPNLFLVSHDGKIVKKT